jgi:eukaryotic-like serine/threonine-protein kinase
MPQATKIGRYEIVEERGHGAMGAVYLARDPAMDRIVALKTIHSIALSGPQSNEYRERFYGEARAAGRLAHPGIVPVFDVGEQDDLPYLVMEYIEGQTLDDAAKSGRRLTLDRVCELGQQIAEALGYAHSHGVVHRDIKPANILLTSKEKYGIERPKITDFGVAKLAASQLTTTGQLLGTPAFMPPEQFTGSVIDGRSDLFSLGVILYWLATGDQPFPGETVTAVSYKVVHTEPVPPRKLNPAIPADLEQVILRTLAKDPAARFQSGEELAQQLAVVRAGRAAIASASIHISGNVRRSSAVPSGGMDATLDSDPALGTVSPAHKTAASPPPVVNAEAVGEKRSRKWLIFGVAAAAVLLIAIWLVYRNKTQPQSPQLAATASSSIPVPSPATPDNSPPAGSSAAASTPEPPKISPIKKSAKPATKPNPAPSNNVDTTATAAPATTAGPAAPVPEPAAVPAAHVDFDPATLKPSENARLRVEADHFPSSLGFILEMDGKTYFERGVKPQTVFDNLYAPPGIHEFRVTAGMGASRKTSNIVSTDFRAKKKKTLRIELRSKNSSSVPQSISADSQLVLTLK